MYKYELVCGWMEEQMIDILYVAKKCQQLQLWLENPKIQLTLENALTQIEAPYNGQCLC